MPFSVDFPVVTIKALLKHVLMCQFELRISVTKESVESFFFRMQIIFQRPFFSSLPLFRTFSRILMSDLNVTLSFCQNFVMIGENRMWPYNFVSALQAFVAGRPFVKYLIL